MHAFRIPMRVRFRGVSAREGLLLEGPAGWGEFSPFPDYEAAAAARWLAAAREAASVPWPHPVRDRVPVNVTVPAVPPEDAAALVAASGCTTAKVKVADGDDEGRVEAVRDALGSAGRLRIDANGAWTLETATSAIRSLARFDLEYVEQPVATPEEMAQLRKLVDVPLAADESVRTVADPLYVARLEAADLVVLKVHPLGGVWPALRIADECGLPVVVSSALETSIGIAAGMALAAALPELPFACGLGTVSLLDGDVTADSLVPVDGMIEVRRPKVDEAALSRYELTDGMEIERWMRRLDAAQAAAVSS
jgi:o-succinylbenzoate synthase